MSVKKRIDYLEHYENGIKIKQEIEIDYKGLDFTESSSEVNFIFNSLPVWTYHHPN